MSRRTSRPAALALLALLATLGGVAAASAQPAGGGFRPDGDRELWLDGERVAGAAVHRSREAVAWLVLPPDADWGLVLEPRTSRVHRIPRSAVSEGVLGDLRIAPDADSELLGRAWIEGRHVHFELGGRAASLAPRTPLTGWQEAATVRSFHPEIDLGATAYRPRRTIVERLRAVEEPIRVEVFFSTWQDDERRVLSRLVRLAEELADSPLEFVFYGLPQPMGTDPQAEHRGLDELPTVVLSNDVKEVGRLSGDELRHPESEMLRILALHG